jgi:hypothetical protein
VSCFCFALSELVCSLGDRVRVKASSIERSAAVGERKKQEATHSHPSLPWQNTACLSCVSSYTCVRQLSSAHFAERACCSLPSLLLLSFICVCDIATAHTHSRNSPVYSSSQCSLNRHTRVACGNCSRICPRSAYWLLLLLFTGPRLRLFADR